jgi:CpeT/CpcT family (DUF1001)
MDNLFRATRNFSAGRGDPLRIAALRAGQSILSLGIVAVALSVLLTGCAENKEKRNEEDLQRLVRWLPGMYDNTAQAKEDARKDVRPGHDPVEVAIVPLESEAVGVSLGRNAFYIQEMAADDPRRVLSQKIVIFKATAKGIVETVATLADPLRWRDGQRDPDIFMGMTPKDFNVVAGCELTWKRPGEADLKGPHASDDSAKDKEPKRLVGSNDPKHCQTSTHAVMGLVQVEMRAELSANELSTAELQYDSNGRLILGNKDEPFYRFRKVGSR